MSKSEIREHRRVLALMLKQATGEYLEMLRQAKEELERLDRE